MKLKNSLSTQKFVIFNIKSFLTNLMKIMCTILKKLIFLSINYNFLLECI